MNKLLLLLFFLGTNSVSIAQDTISSVNGDTIFIRHEPVKVVRKIYVKQVPGNYTKGSKQELNFYFCLTAVKHWNRYHDHDPASSDFWGKFSQTNTVAKMDDGFGFGLQYSRNYLLLDAGYTKIAFREIFDGTKIDTVGGIFYYKNKNVYRYSTAHVMVGREWKKKKWRCSMLAGVGADLKERFDYVTIDPFNPEELDASETKIHYSSLYKNTVFFGLGGAMVSYKINLSRVFLGLEGRSSIFNTMNETSPFKNQRILLMLRGGVVFNVL